MDMYAGLRHEACGWHAVVPLSVEPRRGIIDATYSNIDGSLSQVLRVKSRDTTVEEAETLVNAKRIKPNQTLRIIIPLYGSLQMHGVISKPLASLQFIL